MASIPLGKQESLWPRDPLRELMLLEVTAGGRSCSRRAGFIHPGGGFSWKLRALPWPLQAQQGSWSHCANVDWHLPKQKGIHLDVVRFYKHWEPSLWDCLGHIAQVLFGAVVECVNMFLQGSGQGVSLCVFPWSHYCCQVKCTFLRDSFKSWCLSEFFFQESSSSNYFFYEVKNMKKNI